MQMTPAQHRKKRIFDFVLSVVTLLFFGWFILLVALLAFIDTGKNGFFRQIRIGKNAKPFKIIKIRTLNSQNLNVGSTSPLLGEMPKAEGDDPRNPSKSGLSVFLRKTKLDELPQLWNVLVGQMSFVGPRPDIPGYADKLQDEDRIILSLRPGITGPATLAFKNEEEILFKQANPEKHNNEVLWPEKVRINKAYIENFSFAKDLRILWKTI